MANPAPLDENALDRGIFIVLPIAQILPNRKFYTRRIDGHHASGFPSDHPGLQSPDERVQRYARIQQGNRGLHARYHAHYDGVVMAPNVHARFASTLLYAAGYVPHHGVDVSKRRAQIVRLTPEMLQQMHQPGVLHQQRGTHWRIGHFFGQYITQFGLEPIKETAEAVQFLEAKNALERQRLGYEVMRLAAEAIMEPVESLYQSARTQGNISQAQPLRAVRFIMKHFDQRQPDYFDTLEQQLAA